MPESTWSPPSSSSSTSGHSPMASVRSTREGLTDTLGLVAGAGLYAVYAVADIGASDGDRARPSGRLGREPPASGHDRRRHRVSPGPGDQRRDRTGPGRRLEAAAWADCGPPRERTGTSRPSGGGRPRSCESTAAIRSTRSPFGRTRPSTSRPAASSPTGCSGRPPSSRATRRAAGLRSGGARELPQVRGGARLAHVITAASERHLAACRQLGLRVLRIGDEAVVDPQAFSLEGRPIRKVRQSIARVRRHGWRVEVVEGCDVTPALERGSSARWRRTGARVRGV